jgi:hypothetical protein
MAPELLDGAAVRRLRNIHESQPPLVIMNAQCARMLCRIAGVPYHPVGASLQVGCTRVLIAELL